MLPSVCPMTNLYMGASCTVKPVLCDLPGEDIVKYGHIRQVVT